MKNIKWLPILLLWCMVGVGCNEAEPIEKGFVVYSITCYGEWAEYKLQAIKGVTTPLSSIIKYRDSCNKWQVGDTIYLDKRPLDSLTK